MTAKDILANPEYRALAYGGYRFSDRSKGPSVEDIKEDLRILNAMGIGILRTYHARLYDHTPNLLQAIREMKEEDSAFEMYVMLGAWMQCEGAWGPNPNHNRADLEENDAEIAQAIKLAQTYPEIVKVIAVGNESMVHWAGTYYVHPRIILKEVLYLQSLKAEGKLPSDLWITSSDNFASWGGEGAEYHLPALDSLIAAVDYVSMHTYPFHDTHYNPEWWWLPEAEEQLAKQEIIESAIDRSILRAKAQVAGVRAYLQKIGQEKPIHIGETGWASIDNHLYGPEGSGAADEYKQFLYHQKMRAYCLAEGMACFYFEAFDEPWKDGNNPQGSENHFGLITVDGEVKMPLWSLFDAGVFDGLERQGRALRKSMSGEENKAIALSKIPPKQGIQPALIGFETVEGRAYQVLGDQKGEASDKIYLQINPWEGSCDVQLDSNGLLHLMSGTGDWWGASLTMDEYLDWSDLEVGSVEITLSGESQSNFTIGFLSGLYSKGDERAAGLSIGPATPYKLGLEPLTITIPIEKIKAEANLQEISAPLFIKGLDNFDGKSILIHRIVYRP